MSVVTLDMSELGKLRTLLGGASNVVTSQMPGVLDEVVAAVVAQAQRNAPVDSGALRGSIGVMERTGNKLERHRRVGSPLKQALFTEFGTSMQSPQPWLNPAMPAGVEALGKAMEELGAPW